MPVCTQDLRQIRLIEEGGRGANIEELFRNEISLLLYGRCAVWHEMRALQR